MSRQSISERHLRKVGTIGNNKSPSYYVTLPVELVRELNWHTGKEVVVKKSRGRLVVVDPRR